MEKMGGVVDPPSSDVLPQWGSPAEWAALLAHMIPERDGDDYLIYERDGERIVAIGSRAFVELDADEIRVGRNDVADCRRWSGSPTAGQCPASRLHDTWPTAAADDADGRARGLVPGGYRVRNSQKGRDRGDLAARPDTPCAVLRCGDDDLAQRGTGCHAGSAIGVRAQRSKLASCRRGNHCCLLTRT
jgi:hypothetical protein